MIYEQNNKKYRKKKLSNTNNLRFFFVNAIVRIRVKFPAVAILRIRVKFSVDGVLQIQVKLDVDVIVQIRVKFSVGAILRIRVRYSNAILRIGLKRFDRQKASRLHLESKMKEKE